MKIVNTNRIKKEIVEIIGELSCNINAPCLDALKKARDNEDAPTPKFALDMMCKNADIAHSTNSPVCQDTGMCVIFIKIGQGVVLTGEGLEAAINDGVKQGYANLRKSIVSPLERKNTRANTPAVINTKIIDGENIELSVMLKGFGSENMSRLYMLTPAQGIEGVKDVIVETVASASSNPCPPCIVGVGIGGDIEKACLLAKHSLFREVGSHNTSALYDDIEQELLERINALNIGAQGFGGKTTALGVFIESFPTHMSAIPVAINMLCHCQRSKSVIIK